jgi:hypothetical protein
LSVDRPPEVPLNVTPSPIAMVPGTKLLAFRLATPRGFDANL